MARNPKQPACRPSPGPAVVWPQAPEPAWSLELRGIYMRAATGFRERPATNSCFGLTGHTGTFEPYPGSDTVTSRCDASRDGGYGWRCPGRSVILLHLCGASARGTWQVSWRWG